MCAWDETAGASPVQIASLQPENLLAGLPGRAASFLMAPLQGGFGGMDPYDKPAPLEADLEIARNPDFRLLADTYPTYTSIGVDFGADEVVLQDNNLWSVRAFNRLDNTLPGAAMTEPKRVIQGRETRIEYNNGLYIDPDNGDSYSVESDTGDQMVVFGRDADGNVAPKRILYIPHRSYSLAVDEARDELYITVEYPPQVGVYRKEAALNEQPLRRIRGDATLMAPPHGIAIDEKNQLLFVNNWGHTVSFDGSPVRSACCRNQEVPAGNPGTGHYVPPSITVYPLDAEGAVAPLRVIQGDRTGFNWPGNMKVDQDTGDLYLANDVDHSVLVFTGMTYIRGNVPPTRILKGDRTGLSYPTGVFVDTTNQELWVSNLGNASATVYPLKANGNVAPLRTIRSAPLEHRSLTFGRTAAVTI